MQGLSRAWKIDEDERNVSFMNESHDAMQDG